jgi:hypothetical protein
VFTLKRFNCCPLRDVLIILALATITLLRLVPGISTTPFHRDEARWIGNSALLREWRHPLDDKWQDEGYSNNYGTFDEANRRRSQPPLAMYVLSIGIWLQGAGFPTNGYWNMDQDNAWNTNRGNMPSPAQLRAGRWTNVVITTLTVLLIYLIGIQLTNHIGATFGALLFAFNPLVLVTGTRAWADPLLSFLSALAALIAIHFLQRPRWRTVIALGIVLGLGGATKLSPLLLSVGLGTLAVSVLVVTLAWRPARTRVDRRLLVQASTIPITAWLTFLAVYPYFWPAPITHVRRMFAFRADSFELQTAFGARSVSSPWQAMVHIHGHLTSEFGTAAFISTWLEHNIGVGPGAWFAQLDVVLALVGLTILVWRCVRPPHHLASLAVLLMLAGQTAVIVLTLHVDFVRYSLPIALAVAVYAGVAIGQICATTMRYLPAIRSRQSDEPRTDS